jgi:hypothetical protein
MPNRSKFSTKMTTSLRNVREGKSVTQDGHFAKKMLKKGSKKDGVYSPPFFEKLFMGLF